MEALPDGALVVSYSGRMDNARPTFYNSSGVFFLPQPTFVFAPIHDCLLNPLVILVTRGIYDS